VPAIRPMRGPQTPAQTRTRSLAIRSSGDDPPDPAVFHLETGDFGRPVELHARSLCALRQRLACSHGLRDPIAGHVICAKDSGGVQERELGLGFVGREQRRFHPPRHREPQPALELFPPGGGGRHLQAPDRIKAGFAVQLQLRVEPHGLLGELGHRLRGIGLKHQPGRVARRSSRRKQRALLHDDDIAPAQPSQVVSGAATDDPGAHDDQASFFLHGRCPDLP